MRLFAGHTVMFLLMFCACNTALSQADPDSDDGTIEIAPFDFDSTLCGTTKCVDFIISNPGDSAITFIDVTPVKPPFHGEFDLPLTLEPGQQSMVKLCYAPDQALGRDSLVVSYEANIIERSPAGAGESVQVGRVVTGVFRFEGRPVAPELTLQPGPIHFGDVKYGDFHCRNITVFNTGTAPLEISDVINPRQSYLTDLPDPIPPGESATLEICSTPARLGRDTSTVVIEYTDCSSTSMAVDLLMKGWDSIIVAPEPILLGKPGTVVELPVRLYGEIPSLYDVTGYSFSIEYNKTMLYPLSSGPVSVKTLTKGMLILESGMQMEFGEKTARTLVHIRGASPLVNPVFDSVLIRIPFIVLLGDARSSPIRISDVSFNSGMPRAGVLFDGVFVADSLHRQNERLIDGSDRINRRLRYNYPNPLKPSTVIGYNLEKRGPARMTVRDSFGRIVETLFDNIQESGEHEIRFDGSSLPGGSYYYTLEFDGKTETGRMLLVH